MPAFPILGDKVVSKAQYLEHVAQTPLAILQAGVAESPLAESFGLEAVPGFTQIGPNLPLSILIRYVYTGRNPKSLFGGGKPMALVTGLRDYSAYASSSRAVNFLMNDVSPKYRFKTPNVFDAGTNVVAYSPAVLTDSINFTVEMAFDRFPEALFKTISGALKTLSGIPLLLPAQGYLLAASTVISTGSDWADALIDGRAAFSVSDSIDFNLPGVAAATAEFRVLAQHDLTNMTFDPKDGLKTAAGALYDGDEPYVVISLDGAPRPNLEHFAPTVAAAGVLKQFFNMRNLGEASADAVLAGVRLANDLKFRKEATDLKTQVNGLSGDAKAVLQARLDAVLKNISTPELKPS
jgi:hypothetical protein